jgi:hypothetical protein
MEIRRTKEKKIVENMLTAIAVDRSERRRRKIHK